MKDRVSKKVKRGLAVACCSLAVAGCWGATGDGGPTELLADTQANGFTDSGTATTDSGRQADGTPDTSGTTGEDTGTSSDTGMTRDASGMPTVPERFAGSWVTAGGDGTATCGGQDLPLSSGPEGRIEANGDGTLTFELEGGCAFDFDLSGREATLQSGQSCEQQQNGSKKVVDPSGWTLTLQPNSPRIEQTYSAAGTRNQGGQAVTCTFSWDGTLKPGDPSDETNAGFAGTWSNPNATMAYNVTCSGSASDNASILREVQPVGTRLVISEESGGGLSVTSSRPELEGGDNAICTWSADKSGQKATVEEGATCEDYVPLLPSPGSPREVVNSEYTLSASGDELTHVFTGQIGESTSGCAESWSVTYQRTSK